MMDRFKRHLPFIMASVLCLPFLLFLLAYLIMLAMKAAGVDCPDFITHPLLTGLYWLSIWRMLALPVLLLVSVSVIAAWFQKVKTGLEIVLISIYSVVMLLHIGFVLLCFVIKPMIDL